MGNWRDAILRDFVPQVSKLTLVADPDSLLTEEKLTIELRQRGFDLIEFADPVEFRFAYESRYRDLWDRSEQTDLVVILRLSDAELDALPYDLLQAGRKLAFNLGDLFPNLSYPVIERLDRSLLDTLYAAQIKAQPGRLGDNATKDFILYHVFNVDAEPITNETELLRTLLRLHYTKRQMPVSIAERLAQLLEASGCFPQWPLLPLIADNEAFFAFLQERWPLFLGTLGATKQIKQTVDVSGLHYPGPERLPFDHQDVRVYIDNLFIEGSLQPVKATEIAINGNEWIRSGIIEATQDDEKVRVSRLFELVQQDLPSVESRHTDWINFALKWAELSALMHCGAAIEETGHFLQVGSTVNAVFAEWLQMHYSSLINLPPTQPAMLHHLPRRLAREVEDAPDSRIALLVVDGLALDQWVTIRQNLQQRDPSLMLRESATFAWVPTITSVSRQAIFAGTAPLYFPQSISSTNRESALWKQFWEGVGLSRLDIVYQRGLGDGNVVDALDSTFAPGQTKVIGLVVDKVDKIMHGMQLGAAGMHNQIKQWCEGGFLYSLIDYLLEHDYQLWLTADHGNIECRGKGRPSEGVIAETRGERVRVYPTSELRSSVAQAFPFAHEWNSTGLPSNYLPLVTSGTDAFINPNDTIVGHGGIAIEEVIVPLIKIERRTA
ncbi:MAG: BREX-3 system phosphatase PglZ [Caldilineaceae bacterium]